MTFRNTARSIYAMLPIPEGVRRALRRLHTEPGSPTSGKVDPPAATTPPILCADPTITASIQSFRSKSEYDGWRDTNQAVLDQRIEQEMTVLPGAQKPFVLTGYCVACESINNFIVDNGLTDNQKPFEYSSINWRESLLCEGCGLNNRMRASIDLFKQYMKASPTSKLYMTEQVTPMYVWAKSRYPGLVGSEYLGDGKSGGYTYEGIRHEDTTELSFESDSLDCVLSFDVLEHIPDYKGAIKEIFRCLHPGGFLLLSAPFVSDNYPTRVRAQLLSDGGIEHLLPPEYHGNPTDPDGGSLCFYHFGWDLLDEIRAVGFTDACVLGYYAFERGNFGKSQLFFWAQK